jgi:hypothetical protein
MVSLRVALPIPTSARTVHLGGHKICWVDLTVEECKTVYDAAKERGLLLRYEFSGIAFYGPNRTYAADLLLEATRQKVFRLLRREFGSSARFWIRPTPLSFLGIDFYWRKARLGLAITGPLIDDLYRGDPRRTRDSKPELEREFDCRIPVNMRGLSIIKIPYYSVWHRPSEVVNCIKKRLVASGQYPRLLAKN